MDSSSSSPPTNTNNTSLAFSLSNHFPNPPHSSSSHLSLFHSFTPYPPPTPSLTLTGSPEPTDRGTTNLSIFSGGNKLENFLGNSTATTRTTTYAPTELHRLSTDIYDYELKKTIAACFPHGYPTEPNSEPPKPSPKKTVDTFGQRTSIYRGVTRHRWTGRYEAHLWDNSCRREGQSRKGRQVYLGGYDKEEKAARAYDLAALKYWGPTTTTNFPICNYEKELDGMKNMTRQEFVASLRRKSSGFSRGASIYRGVTRHHQHGRWQARIGRVAGNKDLYLGTFSTQEEAAEAYDIAAIKFRGLNAVTNFDMSRYDVKSIANSSLPIGGLSNKNSKVSTDHSLSESKSIDVASISDERTPSTAFTITQQPSNSTLSFAIPIKQDPSSDYWSNILGFNSNNSNNNPSHAVLPSSTPFNMDFSSHVPSNTNGDNNGGFFSGSVVQQQQNGNNSSSSSSSSSSSTSSIPFATPIFSLNSTNSYGNNWINNGHTFQTHAKPSLFQTPIFGME
ncbi:AP2-like ethylene-responsive transcription factor AIL5 isoform X2 [Vicia villosa]|uniref:AP2-like ethylene-responsive transcription factor AIL5 isoform X1 n=1 Tax=Vicia villosa TaxID=3911 RepID=UPI00273C8EAA|nr:AP2-like ethylene-responsive transcription factor AIL5 isoform X1 [Vicia villosa]XP_058755424.1 AP2-like ethylene-responsive transcription factor AIL5 isoform X2 [Vicia villosa]